MQYQSNTAGLSPRAPGKSTSRYRVALSLFDAANAEDPTREEVEGVSYPRELLYARRMTERLESFAPDASEALRLAARCQHIRRWTTPRNVFPAGRAGYRAWRSTLAAYHAEAAGELLTQAGYDQAKISRVQALVRKDDLTSDTETTVLEDVACLVFLEHHADEFARRHGETTCVRVLRKTWRKMSERGRTAALDLALPAEVRRLVSLATTG